MTQNKTPQNSQTPQKRYICSVCYEPFSYPAMPYRVYSAEINEHGIAASTTLLYSASRRDEVEAWVQANCRRIVTCV